jgi:two-component system KDP operon response regulator KdpE
MCAANSSQRILIADKDSRHIRLLREVLSTAGYDVISIVGGKEVIGVIAIQQPDLILMDTVLDKEDGYQVCRQVREFSDVPIIIVSARDSEGEMLAGFEAGADDYITKPFSSKLLLARVRAVLKRAQKADSGSFITQIEFGDVCIDLSRRSVSVAGNEVYLTATEYNLLYQLAIHLNQVMLHEQLLTEVWGPEYRKDVDYLRSYIHYLRKKLERDPSNPEMIHNIQGVGYMLTAPDSV